MKDAKAGMQQAIEYAALLDVPFCFSSNGQSFVFRDATAQGSELESNLAMDAFPSPEQLWEKYCAHKGWSHEAAAVNAQPYQSDKKPRYYQLTAINRTVEAISRGQDRVLLVMATGTGKTYTAFQIIWACGKAAPKSAFFFWRIAIF